MIGRVEVALYMPIGLIISLA